MESIKNVIIKEIEEGSKNTRDLLILISRTRKTTKQAFYKALRDLSAEEKITIHGKRISLSLLWITEQQKHLERIASTYGITTNSELLSAEKSSYTFKTLATLDIFLSHLFLLVAEKTSGAIFIYNQHEWYSYGREATNTILVESAHELNRPILITVIGTTDLDRALAQSFNEQPFQYYMSNAPLFPQQFSYNIYGEYIVTIKINAGVQKEIDCWFKKNISFSKEAQEEMRAIVHKKSRHVVVVEKNERKAESLVRRLKKYFIIKP